MADAGTALAPPRRVERSSTPSARSGLPQGPGTRTLPAFATVTELAGEIGDYLAGPARAGLSRAAARCGPAWASNHRAAILLVSAYLVMRILLLISATVKGTSGRG